MVKMLRELLKNRIEYSSHIEDGEEFHSSEQNVRLVAVRFPLQEANKYSDTRIDAEEYYKAMYFSSAESWNFRDPHKFETLQRILDHKGKGAKAVVWVRNSHLGNARASFMGWHRNELNPGQLARKAVLTLELLQLRMSGTLTCRL
jgi:erythromycin esterase-like protein